VGPLEIRRYGDRGKVEEMSIDMLGRKVPEPVKPTPRIARCATCGLAFWFAHTLTPSGNVGEKTKGTCDHKPDFSNVRLPEGAKVTINRLHINKSSGVGCPCWEKAKKEQKK
jgi:hypothetical protein